MNTKSAIQAMLDGKKVRLPHWDSYDYIMFSDTGELINEKGNLNHIGNSDEWEIYEEPKPKQTVVIEKWLCRSDEGLTIRWGDDAYFEFWSGLKKVKLLDTYEVEL
jgi:hypothetical protein